MKLTKGERRLLRQVEQRGLLFMDNGVMDYWNTRWVKKLVAEGYVTKTRESGPFGAFGHWLHITDAGREAL